MRPFHHITIVFAACFSMFFITWWLYDGPWWLMLVLTLLYIHMLVLGSIFIKWNFYLPAYHNAVNTHEIALSFDDGPGKETEAILDILKEKNVPAAFFSIGKNAVGNPFIVKRWYDEGHLVGNHSYHHGFNFDWQSAAQMQKEMQQTNEAIKDIIDKTPKMFRPPYGVTNPNLAKAVKKSGMYAIGWSLRSFDTKAKNKEVLLQSILGKLKGGDIILLHDSMTITREILTDLIDSAREKGFTFVRVDKMLRLPAYE